MKEKTVSVDIVIFGGGIAGLWALHRLRALGFQVILLENKALGNGQTLKSQGIIHGGIKFALKGFLTGSANAVEAMPSRWKDALQGKGEIDLRTAKILSPEQLLWSTGNLASEITNFFASKTLNSRVKKLERKDFPLILQNTAFKGSAYRLEEIVLDTPSLIEALAKPYQEYIFKINEKEGYEFKYQSDNPQSILSLQINSGSETLNIKAQRYLFTAGEGNETLCAPFPKAPLMQRRSLQMVMVKHSTPYPFFAHCIDNGVNPRVTITTHPTKDGQSVWYIGGQIAEDGANRTEGEQIEATQKELKALFPWLDLNNIQIGSLFVDRAEHKQPGGKRPDSIFVETLGNIMVAWPTKFALSPLLSDEIIGQLNKQNVYPSLLIESQKNIFANLEKPKIAVPPWEQL